MIKVFYWAPFISKIATPKAVINSAISLNKYSNKKIQPSIINLFGEWDFFLDDQKKHNLNLAQMSLKFLEIQPFVTSVIIGATTMEQLKTNIESVNIKLTDEIINEINEVQSIYPNPCP